MCVVCSASKSSVDGASTKQGAGLRLRGDTGPGPGKERPAHRAGPGPHLATTNSGDILASSQDSICQQEDFYPDISSAQCSWLS